MGWFWIESDALWWQQGQEVLCARAWGVDGIRVQVTRNSDFKAMEWAFAPQVSCPAPEISIGADDAVLCNGRTSLRVSKAGLATFTHSASDAVLLQEVARSFKAVGDATYRVHADFQAYESEHLYGLGQHQHGFLDQKGCVVDLHQRNTEVTVPFMVSSRRYGFLWNNPAIGRVELGHNRTRWVAERTAQLDYWVCAGPSYEKIMESYADVTGHPPAFPAWAAGFWQSKLRYQNQEELLSVAREYKRRGLPLSVVVIDYFHWTLMGEWKFNSEDWPDPTAMVEELREMGVELMVSVWPTVNPVSPAFRKMREQGLLLETERGVPAVKVFVDTRPSGPVHLAHYDPSNGRARQYLWERIRENYYSHGIRVFWLDACEPEMVPLDWDNIRYSIGNGAVVSSLFPLLHQKAFWDGLTGEGEDEIIMLSRSAWAGSQRYGAAVWSGDIPSTFQALQAQVRAGLNIAMSGIPWWTTDIGGFHSGDPSCPHFRELIVRWFQYGAFCPLFRLHGVRKPGGARTGGPNEVWAFGESAYEMIRQTMSMRERLRPYIMKQMRLAHTKGTPPMRPLFFDFPEDPGCYEIDDQFLFGPDILVAPVLEEGVRQREVYLPEGTSWTDACTGERFEGGCTVVAAAPLERIPLFLRAGAELPVYP